MAAPSHIQGSFCYRAPGMFTGYFGNFNIGAFFSNTQPSTGALATQIQGLWLDGTDDYFTIVDGSTSQIVACIKVFSVPTLWVDTGQYFRMDGGQYYWNIDYSGTGLAWQDCATCQNPPVSDYFHEFEICHIEGSATEFSGFSIGDRINVIKETPAPSGGAANTEQNNENFTQQYLALNIAGGISPGNHISIGDETSGAWICLEYISYEVNPAADGYVEVDDADNGNMDIVLIPNTANTDLYMWSNCQDCEEGNVAGNPCIGVVISTTGTVTDETYPNYSDGYIMLNSTTGGTSPYTYLWSDGQTGTSATGLTAGTYSVTITDYDGCTATFSYTLHDPIVPCAETLSIVQTDMGNCRDVRLDL